MINHEGISYSKHDDKKIMSCYAFYEFSSIDQYFYTGGISQHILDSLKVNFSDRFQTEYGTRDEEA